MSDHKIEIRIVGEKPNIVRIVDETGGVSTIQKKPERLEAEKEKLAEVLKKEFDDTGKEFIRLGRSSFFRREEILTFAAGFNSDESVLDVFVTYKNRAESDHIQISLSDFRKLKPANG